MAPEPLRPMEARVLFFRGDHGPNATTVPRAAAALPSARVVTLPGYEDAAWSNVVADRLDEIRQGVLGFLEEMTRREGIEPVQLPERTGEVAGVSYRVRGSGPGVPSTISLAATPCPTSWSRRPTRSCA